MAVEVMSNSYDNALFLFIRAKIPCLSATKLFKVDNHMIASQELSLCRLNSEYHKAIAHFFIHSQGSE